MGIRMRSIEDYYLHALRALREEWKNRERSVRPRGLAEMAGDLFLAGAWTAKTYHMAFCGTEHHVKFVQTLENERSDYLVEDSDWTLRQGYATNLFKSDMMELLADCEGPALPRGKRVSNPVKKLFFVGANVCYDMYSNKRMQMAPEGRFTSPLQDFESLVSRVSDLYILRESPALRD